MHGCVTALGQQLNHSSMLTLFLGCTVQVRHWADLAAAAGQLLAQTLFARRPGVHVVHVTSEMVPLAKVSRHSICVDVSAWCSAVMHQCCSGAHSSGKGAPSPMTAHLHKYTVGLIDWRAGKRDAEVCRVVL